MFVLAGRQYTALWFMVTQQLQWNYCTLLVLLSTTLTSDVALHSCMSPCTSDVASASDNCSVSTVQLSLICLYSIVIVVVVDVIVVVGLYNLFWDDRGRPLPGVRSIEPVVCNFRRKQSNVRLCYFCTQIFVSPKSFTFSQVFYQDFIFKLNSKLCMLWSNSMKQNFSGVQGDAVMTSSRL